MNASVYIKNLKWGPYILPTPGYVGTFTVTDFHDTELGYGIVSGMWKVYTQQSGQIEIYSYRVRLYAVDDIIFVGRNSGEGMHCVLRESKLKELMK